METVVIVIHLMVVLALVLVVLLQRSEGGALGIGGGGGGMMSSRGSGNASRPRGQRLEEPFDLGRCIGVQKIQSLRTLPFRSFRTLPVKPLWVRLQGSFRTLLV